MKDRHQCECGTTKWMAFECVACCVRWLSGMTREEIRINAPAIEYLMGSEHMEKVREAWKQRKGIK